MTKKRKQWEREYEAVEADIEKLRRRIDELGTKGEDLVFEESEHRDPDVIACYASNSLEGTLALLRDLYSRVTDRGDPHK